jgi:hypothetical protein
MDYPNMSYCAAENTLRAINQLIDLINDGQKNGAEPGGYEYRAIHNLCNAAADLAELCEEQVEFYQDNLESNEDE